MEKPAVSSIGHPSVTQESPAAANVNIAFLLKD